MYRLFWVKNQIVLMSVFRAASLMDRDRPILSPDRSIQVSGESSLAGSESGVEQEFVSGSIKSSKEKKRSKQESKRSFSCQDFAKVADREFLRTCLLS